MRYTIIYETLDRLQCQKYVCPVNGLLPQRIIRHGRLYEFSRIQQILGTQYIFTEQEK